LTLTTDPQWCDASVGSPELLTTQASALPPRGDCVSIGGTILSNGACCWPNSLPIYINPARTFDISKLAPPFGLK